MLEQRDLERALRAAQVAEADAARIIGVETRILASAGVRRSNLYQALSSVSEKLGASYAQVREDLDRDDRTSWAGTAHEIREIVASLLRELAPDAQVKAESWYKQVPNTVGPTQKQRAKYVLRSQGAGSKAEAVTAEVDLLEDKIASLVRSTYARASDAAHTMKGRTEARHLFRYLEAFAHDLLNLD